MRKTVWGGREEGKQSRDCGELGFKYVKNEMSIRYPSGGSSSKLKRRIRNQVGPKLRPRELCIFHRKDRWYCWLWYFSFSRSRVSCHVKLLRTQKVVYISCGEEYTAVLTKVRKVQKYAGLFCGTVKIRDDCHCLIIFDKVFYREGNKVYKNKNSSIYITFEIYIAVYSVFLSWNQHCR